MFTRSRVLGLCLCFVVLLAAATFTSGCSRTPPKIVAAEGTVTINGKPLAGAEVQFVPMIQGFGGEYIATALTDESGHFVLAVMGQSGACAVDHKVTISEGPFPAKARGESAAAQTESARFLAALKNRPIPPQYGSVAQSPLSMKVTADRKQYDIALTR